MRSLRSGGGGEEGSRQELMDRLNISFHFYPAAAPFSTAEEAALKWDPMIRGVPNASDTLFLVFTTRAGEEAGLMSRMQRSNLRMRSVVFNDLDL